MTDGGGECQAALTPRTRLPIIRTIRRHSATSLPAAVLPLVVEIFGAALRADVATASVFLQSLRRDGGALSALDVATVVILSARRSDKASVSVLPCVTRGACC